LVCAAFIDFQAAYRIVGIVGAIKKFVFIDTAPKRELGGAAERLLTLSHDIALERQTQFVSRS
jgi:hypothetical protein